MYYNVIQYAILHYTILYCTSHKYKSSLTEIISSSLFNLLIARELDWRTKSFYTPTERSRWELSIGIVLYVASINSSSHAREFLPSAYLTLTTNYTPFSPCNHDSNPHSRTLARLIHDVTDASKFKSKFKCKPKPKPKFKSKFKPKFKSKFKSKELSSFSPPHLMRNF